MLRYQQFLDYLARHMAFPFQQALLLLLSLLPVPPPLLLAQPPALQPQALLQLYCVPGCGLPCWARAAELAWQAQHPAGTVPGSEYMKPCRKWHLQHR